MSNVTNIMIPDIGDFKSVEVVEILVRAGQSVQKEDPLITLESEKATMDVPAPCSGTVVEVRTAVGDEVSEGSLILLIEKAESQHDSNINASQKKAEPESIRGMYGLSIDKNSVHGSDSIENAKSEIDFFFS